MDFVKHLCMFLQATPLLLCLNQDQNKEDYPLREKCPNTEFCWSVFSRIRTEYGEIQSISLYLVRMQENAGKIRTRIIPNTDTFYAVLHCSSLFIAYFEQI